MVLRRLTPRKSIWNLFHLDIFLIEWVYLASRPTFAYTCYESGTLRWLETSEQEMTKPTWSSDIFGSQSFRNLRREFFSTSRCLFIFVPEISFIEWVESTWLVLAVPDNLLIIVTFGREPFAGSKLLHTKQQSPLDLPIVASSFSGLFCFWLRPKRKQNIWGRQTKQERWLFLKNEFDKRISPKKISKGKWFRTSTLLH